MTLNRPRVLAIDDNPENLVVLATALQEDFDFQLAACGLDGLALAAATPPDLILLDVMMPDIDGFEICRRFKTLPALRDIPIIFLTALADLGSEVSGLAEGGADYITKPINVELVRQRMRNILRLTQLTAALKASEERLRLVMEATGEGVWDWLIPGGQVMHNAAWCRLLGLDESFLTHPLALFIEHIHPDDLPAVQQALASCLAGEGSYASEHRMRHADGRYFWVADRGKVVARDGNGQALRMVGSVRNIDERKQHEAEIRRLAFYDTLTELPNRRLLIDRLQQAIARHQRHGGYGALMFLDMDRFKLLNDTHGHAMGDALLIEVAQRLQACVRKEDTVARLGGDEFVVMLEQLDGSETAALAGAGMVGEKILASLNRAYRLGQLDYASTPSIGLSLFSGRDGAVEDVLKRADAAMYRAKAAGRNTLCYFAADET